MSALGHKQTFALQKNMSALPPLATLIAYALRAAAPFIWPGTDRALHHVITKKRNFTKLVIWRIVKVVRSD
jgi:hypothetical protein